MFLILFFGMLLFGQSNFSCRPPVGEGTDEARLFTIDPVVTPAPADITLGWVADDLDGSLTSARDDEGIRKIQAFTCVDEGQTIYVLGVGEQKICTLRQLANKYENGNFVYEDWEKDINGEYNDTDIAAEVAAYYHAQKIYDFVTAPEVGVFDHLPGRHKVKGKSVPINIVANYRSPVPAGAEPLAPSDVAFYQPFDEAGSIMQRVDGLTESAGDYIVLGQAESWDFAYGGQSIYHEFGHAIVKSTANTGMIYPDVYGLNQLPRNLNEGIANTFAFLVSDTPLLHAYLEEMHEGFLTHADNASSFPADIHGFAVGDGDIVLGANWSALQYLKEHAAFSNQLFTRMLLKTLINMKLPDGRNTFQQYATIFLETLAQEGYEESVPEIRDIFDSHGLLDDVRAKDITGYDEGNEYLYMGGNSVAPWNTVLFVTAEDATPVSPGYVQTYVDLGEGETSVVLDTFLFEIPSMAPFGDFTLKLYGRQGAPISWDIGDKNSVTVERNFVAEPELKEVETDHGTFLNAIWRIKGLTAGTRYYFQFVNYGVTEGVIGGILVQKGAAVQARSHLPRCLSLRK